jgi:hypothetical protein
MLIIAISARKGREDGILLPGLYEIIHEKPNV